MKTLGFLFPGQGSQSVGMLADLRTSFSQVKNTFDQASDILGYDLWDITQNNPDDKLNQTEYTQPALLAAGVAVWRCWNDQGAAKPAFMAGHSLGEYTALVCAGAMEFSDAISIASKRGQYMQAAVPAGTGAMAAIIGMDNDAVAALCEEFANGEVLTPANFNSPGQVVIAGSKAAVERAVENAKPKGAKLAKVIPVSVPSHCALMAPAAEQLAADLQAINIQEPTIPVVQNFDVQTHKKADAIREALIQQLVSPVRWVECVELMKENGLTDFIECGPGNVLVGLNKRIDRSFNNYSLKTVDEFNATLEKMSAISI